MPQQLSTAVENNFTKGLVTEYTALNFPENAATDTDNCTYTLVGDVTRRLGIDYEPNAVPRAQNRTNCGISPLYKWNNAGGSGTTELVVQQVGAFVSFYRSSTATVASPLSNQFLQSFDISTFVAAGGTFDISKEAQFADGNGYLFIYHPSCDPMYCIFVGSSVDIARITVQIRDFTGDNDRLPVNIRPSTLGNEHLYNLSNQGWTQGAAWNAASSDVIPATLGSHVFTVAAGITGVTVGDAVVLYGEPATFSTFFPSTYIASGNVTAYVGTSMTINFVSLNGSISVGSGFDTWVISPTNHGYISTWASQVGGFPSNADVWWYFKNSSDVFNPGTTIGNVTLNTGAAPKGHYILDAFNQQRDLISAVPGITDVITTSRPKTGTWFQGRVWYAGVDGFQPALDNAYPYSWSSSIYFSQIVNDITQFGNCYQTNDPTSETLFDLLPTDGGVIQIQECAGVYKLFPIQNGMLVFAVNGVWFITGSQGIGFSANDYTITKISSIQSISNTSFVNVEGLPYFWNEEGIYCVQPTQGGGLAVQPITYDTIWSFYQDIPTAERQYARGTYDPLNYTIQWIYKDTIATSITDRYTFNKILNYNIKNKAFYPYTLDISNTSMPSLNGLIYVTSPGGSPALGRVMYSASRFSAGTYSFIFAKEFDENYVDWGANIGPSFESYFITGYKLRGQAIHKFQPQYIQVYSRVDDSASGYKIQGIWNYAISGNSGKFSSLQNINLPASTNYSTLFRRHKIRGSGYALQFKVTSQTGKPFDIQGWAVVDTVNTGT